MSRFGRPHVWFPLVLLALAGGGAWLLAAPECTQVSARNLNVYWLRHYWQCAFDATSAACGVGLLTYDLDDAYTPRGRWVLTGIGLIGAVLFVGAATQGWRRVALASGWPLPLHPFVVALLFVALQAAVVGITWLVETGGGGAGSAAGGISGATRRGVAAGSGLGFITGKPLGEAAWIYALLGWLVGACCAVCAVTAGSPGRVGVRGFYVATRLASFVVFLLVATVVLWKLESPRGLATPDPRAPVSASPSNNGAQFGLALTQTAAAGGGGFSPVKIADRGVSEGGKALLAAVVLVGGVAGGPAAGVGCAVVLAALGGIGFLAGRGRIGALDAAWVRTSLAAGAAVIVTVILTFVVALGLLSIETYAASKFQSPPTFADALLDAASAIGGASLTSGVTATVTGDNLTMGIQQANDLFQYGMSWLMAAMLAGRFLPILALGWATGRPAAVHDQNPSR